MITVVLADEQRMSYPKGARFSRVDDHLVIYDETSVAIGEHDAGDWVTVGYRMEFAGE